MSEAPSAPAPRRASHKFGVDFALNTGTNIPAIGFGTGLLEPERVREVIGNAIDEGFRHFDCAYEYRNQKEIGLALKAEIDAHKCTRNELFITSKLWNTDHRKHQVYSEMERCLKELHLHHLDLWIMHWPFAFHHYNSDMNGITKAKDFVPRDANGKVLLDEVSLEETWTAMEEMHKNGKTRAIGVSNLTLPMLKELLSFCTIPPAVLQLEYHPYLQSSELVSFCKEQGIHVTAYSPLGSQRVTECSRKLPVLMEDPEIVKIAQSYNKTPSQIILAWNVLNQISSIPKCTQLQHMKENLQTFNFILQANDAKKLDALDKNGKIRYISPKDMWNLPLFPDELGEEDGGVSSDDFGQMYGRSL